jgi:1-acyl-sn-glycerol-3-phosphate acyltransferase
VAITGTYELWPYDRSFPKPGRTELRFGKPLSFERHKATPTDRFVLRSVTDEIMYEIMMLSGQEYVDDYGSRAKAHIEEARRADREPDAGAGGGSVPDEAEPDLSRPEDTIVIDKAGQAASRGQAGPAR